MKHIALLSLLFFLVLETIAQKDSACQSFIKKRYPSDIILLSETQQGSAHSVPFSDIRVIDLRKDTSRLGFSGWGSSQRQMVFRTTVANTVASWLHQHYTHAKNSLLVAIKDLWLFDDIADLEEGSAPKNISRLHEGDLAFRFEAYLPVHDGYIPLTYLDTTVISTLNDAAFMARHQLPELIDVFMKKVSSMDLDAISGKKRTVSYAQIDSFSRTRFNYAMDTAVNLNKGVYTSVEEFRNNQPSILKYDITKGKNSTIKLHVSAYDGNYDTTHVIWGFCDGTTCFIMLHENFFPILPVQHQFYVLGPKEYLAKTPAVPIFVPGASWYGQIPATVSPATKLMLLRLDIQSGEVTP